MNRHILPWRYFWLFEWKQITFSYVYCIFGVEKKNYCLPGTSMTDIWWGAWMMKTTELQIDSIFIVALASWIAGCSDGLIFLETVNTTSFIENFGIGQRPSVSVIKVEYHSFDFVAVFAHVCALAVSYKRYCSYPVCLFYFPFIDLLCFACTLLLLFCLRYCCWPPRSTQANEQINFQSCTLAISEEILSYYADGAPVFFRIYLFA